METAVAVTVLAVLTGIALPAMQSSIQRHHVEGVTAQLKADLRYGYSEAIARGQTVHITFAQTPAGSCYVIATPEACPCDTAGQALCKLNSVPLRTALLPSASGITLVANVKKMSFDGRRNTITPAATFDIRSRGETALQAIVNVVGRTRICAPTASDHRHPAC